mgnify:CR=1 FL=1
MIYYTLNKETGIVETTFEGEISSQEMIEYINSVREDKELPQTLRIFSDATRAKLKERFGIKNLKQFLKENKFMLEQKEFVYDGFLISKPFETALVMLYKEFNKFENYRVNVFSTKGAAITWLKQF